MHTAYFHTQTILQSNTAYRFDSEKSNIFLSDTQKTPDPKYHDICPQFNPTPKAPHYHSGVTVENCIFDHPSPLKATYADRIVFTDCTTADGTALQIP